MGKAGGSLECAFPPQGGGRSPRRVDPLVGRTAERPLGKIVVVVVVDVVVVLVVVVVVVVFVIIFAAAYRIPRISVEKVLSATITVCCLGEGGG